MKTIVTDFAKFQLREIFNYYAAEVSIETASKLISKIIDAIEDLERHPTLGTKEPLLESLKRNHKFLVTGNYKIIFHIQSEIIHITDVFDCRQNPSKIITRNKRS